MKNWHWCAVIAALWGIMAWQEWSLSRWMQKENDWLKHDESRTEER